MEITYSEIDNVMVGLYDEIDQGMVLGSYNEKFVLKFEYLDVYKRQVKDNKRFSGCVALK